jgi:muconolactone delta-isomerase
MNYFVEMRLADSGRSGSPADGLVLIEQYVLPTLEHCQRLEAEGRILAGGPVSGAIALAFIIRAESAREIDDIVESIPIWPRMITTVTPLTSWSDRALALTPRLERLKSGRMPGEHARSAGATS